MTVLATRLASVTFALRANGHARLCRRTLLRIGRRLRASQHTSEDTQPQRKRGCRQRSQAKENHAALSLPAFPSNVDTHAPSSQLGVFYPHDAHRIIGPLRHCAPRPKTRVLHHRVEFIGRPRSRHHRRDRRQHFAHRLWHRQLYRSYFRLRHLVAYGSRFRRATQAAK